MKQIATPFRAFHAAAFVVSLLFVTFAVSQEKPQPDSSDKIAPDSSWVFENCFGSDLKVTYKPELLFPNQLRQMGNESHVSVRVTIDSVGQIENCVVVKSSNAVFDSLALEYAKQFKFEWLAKTGQQASVVIPFHFKQ